MSAISGGWFKLYDDLPDNLKLRRLKEDAQLFFVWYLCIFDRGDIDAGTNANELAWLLRIDARRVERFIKELQEANLLLEDMTPKGWEERQGTAETSADKILRFREKQKKNGMKGGRPRNPEETQKKPTDNPDDNPNINPEDNPNDSQNNPIRRRRRIRRDNTPLPPMGDVDNLVNLGDGGDTDFEALWAQHPNGKAKKDARKAWGQTEKVRPPLAEILSAHARQCSEPGWKKDGGAFVPLLATWLRGERWNDGTKRTVVPVVVKPVDESLRTAGVGGVVSLESLYAGSD